MTTEAPAPLTAFRTGRDAFLASVMTGVNGLEETVLQYELDHHRRTSAAEAEAAELRRENTRLLGDLGEANDKLDTRAPAEPADDSELVEARETIRLLREELDEVRRAEPAEAFDDEAADEAAEAADTLRRELAEARRTITDQERLLAEADVRQDEAATGISLEQARTAGAEAEAARLSRELKYAEQSLDDKLAEGRAAATAEAVRVLASVAADSPDVPLSEAMDLVVIAMDLPDDFAAAPADVESADAPEPAAADSAPAPGLDDGFFDTLQAPTVPENTAAEDGPAEDAAQEHPDNLVFDLDKAQAEVAQAEVRAAPKPGFSLFGKAGS